MNYPAVVKIGDIQIAAERIHREPDRPVEAFDADPHEIRILRSRLSENYTRRVTDLVRSDIGPTQDPRVLRITNIYVGLAATRIQRDAGRLVQLHALHQIDAVLPQIRLPEHPVGRHR